MAYTYDEVMALLGDEAQAVPGAIVVFRNKHIEVAKVNLGSGFEVTAEGLALLDELKATATPKASRKPKKAVESANTSADVVDDLDLSE